MARVILEGMGDNVTVGGDDVDVIGTSNDETITIVSGNVTLDASFANGGDTVELAGEAEAYSAVLSGSRVIITNTATGATVSIPVGTEGLTVEFGGDDSRMLMIEDGAVMFGDVEITTTEATLEAGDEDASNLTAALQQLQGANAALASFLDENETTPEQIADDLEEAQTALAAVPTRAQLQAAIAVEQADVDDVEEQIAAITGLSRAISIEDSAEIALTEAEGDLNVADAELQSAVTFFQAVNGSQVTVNDNGTVTVINGEDLVLLNDDDELILNDAYVNTRGARDLFEATVANEQAQADVVEAQEDLAEASAAVDAIDGGRALEIELEAEQKDLAEAQQDLADRAELVEARDDAQANADTLEELQGNVTDAQDAIEALGFEAPQTVDDGSLTSGTMENDIFILATGDGTGQASIDDFGAEGDDVLFIGANTYTVVNIGDDVDLGATNVGNVGVLEVFVQQDGDNTIMFFEDETFSGSASNGFQGFVLTLNDVDASNVSFDTTGYISLDDSAMVA